MNYVLDLVLFGIFVLFVAMGVFRGFIRSAIHFLGSYCRLPVRCFRGHGGPVAF